MTKLVRIGCYVVVPDLHGNTEVCPVLREATEEEQGYRKLVFEPFPEQIPSLHEEDWVTSERERITLERFLVQAPHPDRDIVGEVHIFATDKRTAHRAAIACLIFGPPERWEYH